MADEEVLRRKCDNPRCETPYDGVKRIESKVEGENTALIDLCATDRRLHLAFRKWAHKTVRPPRIQVSEPPKRRG